MEGLGKRGRSAPFPLVVQRSGEAATGKEVSAGGGQAAEAPPPRPRPALGQSEGPVTTNRW